MTGELHRFKRIANDINCEVKRITKKFLSAGFPRNCFRNTIECFSKDKDDFIIPQWLFCERKKIILRLPLSMEIKYYVYMRFQNQIKILPNVLSES